MLPAGLPPHPTLSVRTTAILQGPRNASAFCRMAAQRLRSEALPGTGGGLELIDWLEIRHDESEPVVEATRSALHYLRTLKQSIPTGPAPVVTNHDDADETEDGDALEGSQGITKRELLERQVHLPHDMRRPATHGHHRQWRVRVGVGVSCP